MAKQSKHNDVKEAVGDAMNDSLLSKMAELMSLVTAQQQQIQSLSQQVFASNPGNATFTAPAKHIAAKPVVDVPTARVQLEAFTDRRVPYISALYRDKAGEIKHDFFDGVDKADGHTPLPKSFRTTTWKGKDIVTTNLDCHLPIGTVLATRQGYGLEWFCVTEKQLVQLDSYEEAVKLVK